jgi:predicted DCC family thiol-disulfide oxidoreductase YuxK
MQKLYVLYDARCGLCQRAREWMQSQPAFLATVFIPAGSALAKRVFPTLDHGGTLEELTVVSDEGGVYRGAQAWLMCLFALEGYRDWSLRLARPSLLPLARQAFEVVSASRSRISRLFRMGSDDEVAELLRRQEGQGCEVTPQPPDRFGRGR